ncbi:Hypothetical predicted protein [Xyrichtys novacula]|uniref:Uncharacterized protein n=1 Tax=Xyrichtys novacula TaxID=13765 RepID=A0AAV1H3V1_XYRNO|nr:Hypothetical predicted protein [Xyrichtys novacula]
MRFTSGVSRGFRECSEGGGWRGCSLIKKEALSEELCSFLYVLLRWRRANEETGQGRVAALEEEEEKKRRRKGRWGAAAVERHTRGEGAVDKEEEDDDDGGDKTS